MTKYIKICISVLLISFFVCSCTYQNDLAVTETYIDTENPPELSTVPLNGRRYYEKDELAQTLAEVIRKSTGNWSVYVESLNNDFELEINNREVPAASTIKLFNMVAVYDEMKKGNLRLGKKLNSDMRSMITVSSNAASNSVVSYLGNGDFPEGAKKVTALAERLGCYNTQEQSMLYDVSGPSTGRNTTSVKDCAVILKKIYNEECILPVYDREMLRLLKQQERDWKIPAGVPKDTVVANKTGENSKVELDVGIVYSPECDYVLCISVTGFRSPQVYKTFSEISEAVYEFFNREISFADE